MKKHPNNTTPKWMRRLVRERMKETGEKYTQALRAVREDWAKMKEQNEGPR